MSKVANFFEVDTPKYVDFNGTAVKIQPELFYFAQARALFMPEIEKAYKKAMEDFDEEVGSLPKFVQNLSYFMEVSESLCEFALKQLVANGAYDMDTDDFFAKYVDNDFDRIKQIHKEMTAEFKRIRARQEEKNEDRDSARRWKNATENRTAGEELLSWGFDKVLGGIDELGNRSEYAAIYNDDTKEELKNEVRMILFNVLEDFTLALYDSTGKDLRNPIPYENIEKAERIFDKLKKKMIPESEWEKVALNIFETNPLQDGLLPWCVSAFKDNDGSFEKIAQLFQVQRGVIETKEKMLKKLVNIKTEEDALESKQNLLDMEKALCYKSESLEQTIEEALVRFDLEARTVEGYVYEERAEANKAREELKKLQSLVKERKPSSSKDYAELLAEIDELGLGCVTSQKHIDDLKSKMQKIAEEEKEKAELEQIEQIAADHIQLTSKESEEYVNCLEKIGFTSKGALAKIQEARDTLNAQRQREQWLVTNCHLSEEEALTASRRMSVVAIFKEEKIQLIDPQKDGSPECLKQFQIPAGEAAFGLIDLGSKNGLALATKGIYVFIAKSTMASKLVSEGAGLIGGAVKGLFKPKWGLGMFKDMASDAKKAVENLHTSWDNLKEKDNEDVLKFIPWQSLEVKILENGGCLGLDSSLTINIPKALSSKIETVVNLLEELK